MFILFCITHPTRYLGALSKRETESPLKVWNKQKIHFYSCGGSIMNENWVLSAGHCCAGLGDDGEIVAGTNDRY